MKVDLGLIVAGLFTILVVLLYVDYKYAQDECVSRGHTGYALSECIWTLKD